MAVATQPDGANLNTTPVAVAAEVKVEEAPFLTYPIDMDEMQDRIRFAVVKSNKVDPKDIPNAIKNLDNVIQKPSFEEIGGQVVYLPIQSGISDTNAVEWGGAELNAIQRYMANKSLEFMGGGSEALNKALADLQEGMQKGYFKSLQGAGAIALAEQAVGVQGLLSRVTGNVLNPNLELLFRGPTLRPFQFQFKLSPRSKKEADRVKQIIRFFKKNMAVQTNENLFLRAPYAFRIQYQHSLSGAEAHHQSIGKIKECALQSFNVDYTPLGSYMTFDDAEATMVSYNISMQFQEIVPITSSDYDDTHSIGY